MTKKRGRLDADDLPIVDTGGDYIVEDADSTISWSGVPYRHLSVETEDGVLINNGSETESVTISVFEGINNTDLDTDGEVSLSVDGQQTTKTLQNGSFEFDITTDKPAGSEIEIVAESLADHPAESDSATIEVVSA